MRLPMRLGLYAALAGAVLLPAAAMAQVQNSYKPMVTAPAGPQDPARSSAGSMGAPAITPPAFSNGNTMAAPGASAPATAPYQAPAAPSGTLSTVPGGTH